MTIPTPPDGMADTPPTADLDMLPADEQPQATVGWWRRNRIALLAIVVLLPVIGIGTWLYQWQIGFSMKPAQTAVVAKADSTVDLNGATWGPIQAGEARDVTGLDVPEDTRVIISIIPVDPDADEVHCEAPRLVQQSTGRQWKPLRSELGVPYVTEEYERCNPGLAEPYQLVVAFVVPDDASGPFWVDVTSLTDARFVRFSIDP